MAPPPNPPPPPPPLPTAFNFTATCTEALVLIPVEVERVRSIVPANYALVGEQAGRVPVFFGLKDCPDYVLDNGTARRVMIGDVGALVESPDGSEGNHYYQFWLVTSDAAVWAAHQALGFRGGVAATTFSSVQPTPVPPPVPAPVAWLIDAAIPWAEGNYALNATIPAVAPTAPAARYTGWFDGPRGVVRMPKDFTYTAFGSGTGSLAAAEGGAPANLTGPSANGSALYNAYALTGGAALAPAGNATAARTR